MRRWKLRKTQLMPKIDSILRAPFCFRTRHRPEFPIPTNGTQGYSFITSVSIRLFPGDGDDISTTSKPVSHQQNLQLSTPKTMDDTQLSGSFVDVTFLFWSRAGLVLPPLRSQCPLYTKANSSLTSHDDTYFSVKVDFCEGRKTREPGEKPSESDWD